VLLTTKSASAIPTNLNFFSTTLPLTSVATDTPDGTLSDITVTKVAIVFSAVCSFFISALIFCYIMNEYMFRKLLKIPYTKLCLQLQTSGITFYLPFLRLDLDTTCYNISVHGDIQNVRVIGFIFPRLYFDWPDLKINNTVILQDVPLPTSLKLSYCKLSPVNIELTLIAITITVVLRCPTLSMTMFL